MENDLAKITLLLLSSLAGMYVLVPASVPYYPTYRPTYITTASIHAYLFGHIYMGGLYPSYTYYQRYPLCLHVYVLCECEWVVQSCFALFDALCSTIYIIHTYIKERVLKC